MAAFAITACSASHHAVPAGGDDAMNDDVPRLSVSSDGQILDPAGNAVALRGWNWGQWGTMQPQDGGDNATQGANVVRIPLRWWGQYGDAPGTDPIARVDSRDADPSVPGHIEPHHLTQLQNTVDAATSAGLWVVLFVDSNCGQASNSNDTVDYCGSLNNDGVTPLNFANSAAMADAYADVWEFVATTFKDHPNIAMYELLPEPNFTCDGGKCDDWTAQKPLYQALIARVRAVDARTPILIGPNGGYDVDHLEESLIDGVDGLIYTGDFLNGAAGKPEKVQEMVTFRSAHNVAMFVQQVGSRKDNPDPDTRAQTILRTLDDADIGWTWWTYREHSANGTGFAPYWELDDGTWDTSAHWLGIVTDCFAPSATQCSP